MYKTRLFFVTLLLLIGSALGAQTIPAVDIYETSLRSYFEKADEQFNKYAHLGKHEHINLKKAYLDNYLKILREEAGRLAKAVEAKVKGSRKMLKKLRSTHKATIQYAEAMGSMTHELCWFDFEKQEQKLVITASDFWENIDFFQTGGSHQKHVFLADTYWRLIVLYQTIMHSDKCWEFNFMHMGKPGGSIGGVKPQQMLNTVRIQEQLRASDTKRHRILNKRMTANLDKDLISTFESIKCAIVRNSAKSVAAHIDFPVEDSAHIDRPNSYEKLDREGFLRGFNNLFTDYAITEVAKLSAKDLRKTDGWAGMAKDAFYFSFITGELEPDGHGGWLEASAGFVILQKVDGKWRIVRFDMVG